MSSPGPRYWYFNGSVLRSLDDDRDSPVERYDSSAGTWVPTQARVGSVVWLGGEDARELSPAELELYGVPADAPTTSA